MINVRFRGTSACVVGAVDIDCDGASEGVVAACVGEAAYGTAAVLAAPATTNCTNLRRLASLSDIASDISSDIVHHL
jgi:hypothetical protein